MDYKNIKIGELIKKEVDLLNIDNDRIKRYLKCNDVELQNYYRASHLDTEILLKFSKILEFDFFRIYSQHLILYSSNSRKKTNQIRKSTKPFRKNIYTTEIIQFILEQISSGQMSKNDVIERYNIPKTTLCKWITKYNSVVYK